MKPFSTSGSVAESNTFELLWEDGERILCKILGDGSKGARYAFMAGPFAAEHPSPEGINRLTHEHGLKNYIDGAWAVRPLEIIRECGRTMLIVEYPGGERLDGLIGPPMEIGIFLRLAIALSAALGRLHGGGLIHKDIKPSNVIVNSATGQVWLTGFGVATRLPRERQSLEPPEFIAGTLAYMAPEQTGRVNRSIDSRSDLYSLGVTFYEMLTGTLPFIAFDPMEWVHCHIARQPPLPSERLRNVPVAISAITMKLLSKTVEDRYQTAAGVESDLRRCLSEWENQGRVEDFTIGNHDTPDRLIIPEKLYGRDREIDTLLTAFDRIVAGGRPELVLVSGYSGIGKSAVVNELHKPLVPPRGLFASGKFDQYKRDIPYATLAQAFQKLIRPLLSKNEADLAQWRDSLREALDPNGLLIIELVPELKHIIGEQPNVPELPPQEAQRRFQLVFRRFIGVFARPEHPLALFLDDLQWLDGATLDLLEDLLTGTDLQNLLLIGAYRDNEVNSTHPLVRKLDAMRQGGAALQDIVLTALGREDLGQMLADSLHCERECVAPLAELIHQKTSGNPFFAIQFISALADEGLLIFDYQEGCWVWDLHRIHAKGFTDNIVELMVGKLNRLPVATRKALQQFACMGNSAEFEMLRMASQGSVEDMHDHLWEAVRLGLIFRADDSYRFLHDRVQEAAYSLIPQEVRAEAHLNIGLLLAAHTPPAKREEAIFEIANQLNRGSHLITSIKERERVAELNLIAGRRAKTSTAYDSALKYLGAGSALLTEETWDSNYELVFAIEYLMAECELLTAEKIAAENRLSRLAERARNRHDFCAATRLALTLYMTLDRSDRCVDVFLDWLRRDGTVWSNHPTREDVMREYERIWTLLGSRTIEELIDMPLIKDPDVLDTLDVFTEIMTPSQLFDENLNSLVICRLVILSLENGNCDASCFAYVWLAMFAGPRFDNYRDGFRFGQLGYDLAEKRGLTRYQARIWMNMGSTVLPWAKHVAGGRELVRRAFDAAYRIGDLTFASYSWDQLVTVCLAAGDPLAEVQTECENGIAFARRVRFGLVLELCGAQLGLIMTLRGLTPTFGCLDHPGYTEIETEHRLVNSPNLVFAEFYYWVRKLQAHFFAGDLASAVDASLHAEPLLWTSAAMFESAEYRLYGALAHAAAWDQAIGEKRQEHFEALLAHRQQLEVWAEVNPETFDDRATIVTAEVARIEGRVLDAEQLYEESIRLARANNFIHNEAIANELAAQFYRIRGFATTADAYLRNARACYEQWGAQGKVNQIDAQFPNLKVPTATFMLGATIDAPVKQMDAEAVIKASQTLSGEMNLPSLIEKLLRLAIEHAGAQRGLLILLHGDGPIIEAEAQSERGKVEILLRHEQFTSADLPESVLQFVLRTHEQVLLGDASQHQSHSEDEYIRCKRPKSLLCLPILKQAKVIGALYLENSLTAHAFTPGRMAVLDVLASQAAISLENARLYSDLERGEVYLAEAQTLSLTGSFGWNASTDEHFWSAETFRIFEYDVSTKITLELILNRVHPHDLNLVKQAIKSAAEGKDWDVEYRLLMSGGAVKYVHVIAHAINSKSGNREYAGAVMDITATRRAEEALRQGQAELAHVSRMATLGELTASIAHEVNQPLTAIVNNANACLDLLPDSDPRMQDVRDALAEIGDDADRASGVIARVRQLVKKTPFASTVLNLRDVITDALTLAQHEFASNHVTIRTDLTDEVPPVMGDRVQLQQVLLNLIVNGIDAMKTTDETKRILTISGRLDMRDGKPEALISVHDTGVGLKLVDTDRLFEAFFTTKPQGMGMGLPISRSIVEAHGGRLWAEPNKEAGATFLFSLPAAGSATS
jgi:predicted ATPase/signal transduction histidine kinase